MKDAKGHGSNPRGGSGVFYTRQGVTVSSKFSEPEKEQLRHFAHSSSAYGSAAMAHYAAAGIRPDTARGRYRQNKEA